MDNKDNLLGILRTLYRWRRPIFIVCFLALLGSVFISLLLPTYYRASTLFLAASPDQAQPELLFGRGAFAPQYYGNENDIDRLLTIAESSELIGFLIDSFDLYDHYGIDPGGAKAAHKVRQKLLSLYEVTKTKRDAIELSVEDRDRELAAVIGNAAREKIDDFAQRLIKENQLKVIRSFESSIKSKQLQLAEISDTLMHLRSNYGIYNTEAQSESLTEQLAEAEAEYVRDSARLESLRKAQGIKRDTIAFIEALVKGQATAYAKLQEKVSLLNKGMANVNILTKQYLEANQSLGTDREYIKLIQGAYQSSIPATILVEPATTPVVKSRPRRSIIVLAATLAAFLFSVIGALLFESYREINWREITDGR